MNLLDKEDMHFKEPGIMNTCEVCFQDDSKDIHDLV